MDEKKHSLENNNDSHSESESQTQKQPYPKSVFFIIGNEFCERFSYYGMKAVLVLYFKNVLMYADNTATLAYHVFAMACYFTPVLGAIIADSLLGKFKTILYISILYAAGNIMLAYASFIEIEWITMIGLTMIALGTGGIKPCVAAFGGDQFAPGQEVQLQRFFSLFYISINGGSLISTALTPIFREDIKCSDRGDCFPLAFGVPAVLMVVALGLFVVGKYCTNYKLVPPAKGNIVVQTCSVVFRALSRKMCSSDSKREHWLDYADDKYDRKLIRDVKALMKVLLIYLPIPIFWALFDQQGSRWTLQALRMDADFFGVYRIKPDQIQVFNPLLIIIMIPLFEYIVYPGLKKLGLPMKPLQRITVGGLLAAGAFVVCGFFQLRIEAHEPMKPSSNAADLVFFNAMPCSIMAIGGLFGTSEVEIHKHEVLHKHNVEQINDFDSSFNISLTKDCPGFDNTNNLYEAKYEVSEKEIAVLVINGLNQDKLIIMNQYNTSDLLDKPDKVAAMFRVIYTGVKIPENENRTFLLKNEDNEYFIKREFIGNDDSSGATYNTQVEIVNNNYKLYLPKEGSESGHESEPYKSDIILKQGGGYIAFVTNGQTESGNDTIIHNIVAPNDVSMLWQIIQYVMITAGEIMFSITGLEFSYSQAPISMKAVLQAAWLLTVAFGNLIVVITASVNIFEHQSYEFFFFAALMVLDMLIFALMAYRYVPNKIDEKCDEDDDQSDTPITHMDKNGSANGTVDKNGHAKNGHDKTNGHTNNGFTTTSDEDTTKF